METRLLARDPTSPARPKTGSPFDRQGIRPLRRLSTVVLWVVLAAAIASCADTNHDRDADRANTRADPAAELGDGAESGRQISPPAATDQSAVDARSDIPGEASQGPTKSAPSTLPIKPAVSRWPNDEQELASRDQIAARTSALAEQFGGIVHFVDHPDRATPLVLVLPQQFVEGETPLIVSLHGFGGNSANHAAYVPLHERVNEDGFALLLPNGMPDNEGNRFWNPTDRCCDGGKSGEDDVAFLTQVVDSAREINEFGPVYFFGYSNGGFMSYHMACKGLPGLRAVASVAGTSYVEDSSCDGAPAVSVLHIHGTEDSVIQFAGDESDRSRTGDEEKAFYAGAVEMVTRWSQRAGCGWPASNSSYASLDLDQFVPGAETQAFRLESACTQGIEVELWIAEGSGHSMLFGDVFVDALLDWLLSQK